MLSFQYSGPPFSKQESTGTFFLNIVPDIDTNIVLHWHYIVPDIVYEGAMSFVLKFFENLNFFEIISESVKFQKMLRN